MAERRKPTKGFVEDKIVRDLVPDPGQPPPESVVLRGYMGKSDRDGHRRLYLDDSLSSWVEIPEDEILHVETTPEDESGTSIWVKRSAQLETKRVESATAPAEFLTGDIASGFRAPLPERAARGLGFERSINFICTEKTHFACPQQTPDFPCPPPPLETPDFPCPVQTPDFPCPPPPETVDPPCPQRTPDLACQTPDFKCPPVATPDFRCPPVATPDFRCPPPEHTPDAPCRATPDVACPPPVRTPDLPCFRATPNPNLCFKRE
jgi:hypothetical protein